MLCRECHTFRGSPYCGACRALTRVKVLLTEGHLRESQEAAVLGILRDTSGALQDLAEQNRGASSREPRTAAGAAEPKVNRETPRPDREKPPLEVKEEPKSPAGEGRREGEASSYIEESEEEEIPVEEPPLEDKRPLVKLPRVHGSVGRALELRPTGKASAAASRAASLRRSEGHHHKAHQEGRRDRSEADRRRGGTRDGHPRERRHRSRVPRSPDHPPSQPQRERKRKRSRSKYKKSKGKSKRERGRVWREANFNRPY